MNPILWRELRVRPRAKGFAAGSLAAFLPAAAILCFYLRGASSPAAIRLQAQSAFETLAALQCLAWLLVAPSLTAPSIASQRERGLLESLQLSGLTPRAILSGTLAAAGAFALLVIFASAPVWMLTFFLGQISFDQIARVAALHSATALLGAAAGLAWSAWTRRAAVALRVSLISLALWGVGSGLAGVMAHNIGPQRADWAAWIVGSLRLFGSTNPVTALSPKSIRPSLLLMPSPSRALVWFDEFATTAPFAVSLCFQLAVAPFLLWLAARGIRANFDEPALAPKKKTKGTVEIRVPPEVGAETRARREAEPFWDFPFVAQLPIENPVLKREIRGKFRQPKVPRWVVIVQSILGAGVALFYLQVMAWAIVRPETRAATWWVLSFIGLGLVMTAAPMMGASNFSRERERGTWEGIHLSPLSAREISGGKTGSALLAIGAFTLPVLPLLMLCVARAGGVSVMQAVLTFAVIGSSAYAFSAFGSLLSWKARRTAPVAAAMLLFVAAQSMLPFVIASSGARWLVAVNPPSALAIIASGGRTFGVSSSVLLPAWCALVLFFGGVACEAMVRKFLRAEGHP
ncbi:MAG TPA: ABC transporter permease [Abditibacteriaceae bacterium]|jgi:ABC-type transport system involved in multi-copper enzyme maturation permease subunit